MYIIFPFVIRSGFGFSHHLFGFVRGKKHIRVGFFITFWPRRTNRLLNYSEDSHAPECCPWDRISALRVAIQFDQETIKLSNDSRVTVLRFLTGIRIFNAFFLLLFFFKCCILLAVLKSNNSGRDECEVRHLSLLWIFDIFILPFEKWVAIGLLWTFFHDWLIFFVFFWSYRRCQQRVYSGQKRGDESLLGRQNAIWNGRSCAVDKRSQSSHQNG